jgi:uncharacterized protein YyaL (SSP411 family)
MHTRWRYVLAAIISLSLFNAAPLTAQEEDTIDWFDNYEKAVQEAKRTNKPIFLEFRCEA